MIKGIDSNKVPISRQLANLHYSEAGKSPRLSDLGEPKEPKPERMPTRFMQNIYRNIDKAMEYDPAREDRPRFDLRVRDGPRVVFEQNKMTPVQAARAYKK